jgi:hypothetical protein
MKDIFGAGDEDAGAARLAPDALVARSRRTVIVIAREECQSALKFDPGSASNRDPSLALG